MAEKNKDNKNINNSSWWQPSKVEKIMLWLTVIAVLISIISNAGLIAGNVMQFNNIYKRLYPILNIIHIYVLLYIMSSLRGIKQLLPAPLKNIAITDKAHKEYITFKGKLKEWIKQHFGTIYWKGEAENGKKEAENGKFDDYVDELVVRANENISKTHRYFFGVFGCFILLYVFELINSSSYEVTEPVLHILTIAFNNIAVLFWFYIYLTFNVNKTTIEIKQRDREGINIKKVIQTIKNRNKAVWCNYYLNKGYNFIRRRVTFSNVFKRPNRFKEYENYEEGKTEEKYKTIEIRKFGNWKFIGLLVLIISIIFLAWFFWYFKEKEILSIELLKKQPNYLIQYYLFRTLSTIAVLLCGCAMLATFSRLASGFKKVPLNAFLVMLFYAAIQPLFFAGGEFDETLKFGQLMFIANLLCLLGKFGLLHLLRWFFGNYQIAYYFIAEQIVKDKSNELDLDELFIKDDTAESNG